MSAGLKHFRHRIRQLASAGFERDPGFRALVDGLSSKAMRAVGIMGVFAPTLYVFAYAVSGHQFSWWDYGMADGVVLWDKVLILLLGTACIVAAARREPFRWGRALVACVVITAGLSSYIDDIIRNSIDFSAAWWAFMLVVAIAAMPYKPWHALILGSVVTVIFVAAPTIVAKALNLPSVPSLAIQQIVFMIVLTLLCWGISRLIYTTRYSLFLKRKRIEYLERLTLDRFRTYVPPSVVSEILKRPENVNLTGEKRTVTMLMSDLRGFSMVAESLQPEQVVQLLNSYLGRMAEVISAYGDTVDDFIGDGIFVIFGAPVKYSDHALRGLACAIDMQRHMVEVNKELVAQGISRIEMGVGVHTGEVVIGSIGSRTRAKYGAVGSHVNLTARVESYTVGGQVLTTERTLQEAGDEVVVGRQMQLSAKGFAEPISIFEVESVGEPYNLSMPVWEENFQTLTEPWPFDFRVLDGKQVTGPAGRGQIKRLSTTGAIAQLSMGVELLSNLKIRLPERVDHAESDGDLYGKVVDEVDGGLKQIRFTAVPVEVAALVRQKCGVSESA